jgi:hypothetical protein
MGTKITPGGEGLVAALQADLRAAKEMGNGLKMVALEMGKSYSWAAEMVRGEQPFPLYKLDAWVRVTGGKYLVGWVADQAGYDIVSRAEIDVETTALQAMGESAEALQAASNALADGMITDREVAVYEKEMADAIEKFHGLDRALKARLRRQHESRRAATLAEAEGTVRPPRTS